MEGDPDWTGLYLGEDVNMEDDQVDVDWSEGLPRIPETQASPTIYTAPLTEDTSDAQTMSTNSNQSLFSGSTISSDSSSSRAYQTYRNHMDNFAFVGQAYGLHNNKTQVPSQQSGASSVMEEQSAASRARQLKALGQRLQSVGDLQNNQIVPPYLQLLSLRNELQEAIINVNDLMYQSSISQPPFQATSAACVTTRTTSHKLKKSVEYRCCICEKDDVVWSTGRSTCSKHVMRRHVMSRHFPTHDYHCPEIGCGQIFQRPDKLKDHFLVGHNRNLQREVLDTLTIQRNSPPFCFLCGLSVHGWDEFYECVMKHCLVSPSHLGKGPSHGHENSHPGVNSLQDDEKELLPETRGRHNTETNPFGPLEPISELPAYSVSDLWLHSSPHGGGTRRINIGVDGLSLRFHDQMWIPQSLLENLGEDSELDMSTTPPIPLKNDSSSQQPKQTIPEPSEDEPFISTRDNGGVPSFTFNARSTPTLPANPVSDLLQRMQVRKPSPHVPVDSNTSKSSQPSDDEEAHSMKTNITRPDQEDEFDLDTGIADNEDMDHILKPGAYYRKLDLLERRTAEICGIEGPKKKAFVIKQCQFWLKINLDLNVARAVRISLDDINDALRGQLVFSSPDGSDKNIPHREWQKLQQLLGNLPLGSPPFESTWADLTYWQFLADALSIGLVSFFGSHICRIDLNLWEEDKSEIAIGNGYSFALQDLACLKDFIGGPAWILGKEQAEAPTTGLKVSLTVEELQQLLRPVWLMGGMGVPGDEGSFIRTEAGYITPLPRHMQTDQSLAEIECHWTSSNTGRGTENSILIRSSSRILIGTEPCTTTGLNINEGCRAQISFLQARILPQLQPSGAHNTYHSLERWDLTMQATLGSYVQAGGVLKWKRNPARKWKTSIIDKCKYGNPNLRSLLSSHIGLEVSACTGNAHRVTLWDALRLSQTTARTGQDKYPDEESSPCRHRVADPDCIKSCWTGLFSTDDIDSSVNIPPEDDKTRKEHIRRLIMNAIIALEDTGVDHDNNLQVHWPFTENARTHRIEPSPPSGETNSWMRVIRDSRDVATFAVASQRCMEVRHGQKRTCTMPCQVGHLTRQKKKTLYTRIRLNPPFQSTCTENHDWHTRDSLMGSEADKLVPNEHFVLGEAALTVQSIIPGTENVIIATAGGSAVKNGWMKMAKLNRRKMFQEDLDVDLSTGHYSPLLVH